MNPPRIVHAVPEGQPDSVAQITARLFPAYTVEGGRVHLAGCTLEDRLFVRLGYPSQGRTINPLVDANGCPVEPDRCQKLGLSRIVEVPQPPIQAQPLLAQFLSQKLDEVCQRVCGDGPVEPETLTAIWCKYAEGKLRFTIGEESVDVPFADWARSVEPPPIVCPQTHLNTYQLARTDDGRIAAAQQIAACEASGRRVLLDEMVFCTSTGKRVLKELTTECPVSGDRLLKTSLVACAECGQMVSRKVLRAHRCRACRHVKSVGKDDPRMARILHEHPQFDRRRGWHLSETANVYILVSHGWLQRVLVVVDKQSLDVLRVATGSRFSTRWDVLPEDQYERVFAR